MKNGTRKKTNGPPAAQPTGNMRDEIQKRAYEIWLNEGGGPGGDLDHWLRAERELAQTPAGRGKEALPN